MMAIRSPSKSASSLRKKKRERNRVSVMLVSLVSSHEVCGEKNSPAFLVVDQHVPRSPTGIRIHAASGLIQDHNGRTSDKGNPNAVSEKDKTQEREREREREKEGGREGERVREREREIERKRENDLERPNFMLFPNFFPRFQTDTLSMFLSLSPKLPLHTP